jgi:hypothetical protein
MRQLVLTFIFAFLAGCSAVKVAVVPSVDVDRRDNSIVVTGIIQSASIQPNYTFKENYLQPTPSVTKKGWKGDLVVSITSVDQGHFPQTSLTLQRALFTNPYRLPDMAVRFGLFPGNQVRVALDETTPREIVPLALQSDMWPEVE